MAVPDYQSLMLPVLVASSKGEVRIGDVVNHLAEELKLSPEERGELLPSGKQTLFSNRVHWAKTYVGKANLIEITCALGQGILGKTAELGTCRRKKSRMDEGILVCDAPHGDTRGHGKQEIGSKAATAPITRGPG
jgi:hypothetical protein